MSTLKLLDSVALLKDRPSFGLKKGDVGCVVQLLSPSEIEVEFIDESGVTIALVPLATSDAMRLNLKLVPEKD